ncbi:MAG: ribosome-associated translation inhibitor RaiA [Desulfobacteraceae bacterium]|nr:ribosome-associated translation inhibitor RaiA [Desulfobacteraceae bacterium]
MQISFTFKKIDSSNALKSYVHEKFDRLDKMFDNHVDAHVVLSVEKIRHIVEINLNCDGLRIHGKEESESMYSSIDVLVDKLRLQIKKHKEKLRRHLAGDRRSIKNNDTQVISPDDLVDDSMIG